MSLLLRKIVIIMNLLYIITAVNKFIIDDYLISKHIVNKHYFGIILLDLAISIAK